MPDPATDTEPKPIKPKAAKTHEPKPKPAAEPKSKHTAPSTPPEKQAEDSDSSPETPVKSIAPKKPPVAEKLIKAVEAAAAAASNSHSTKHKSKAEVTVEAPKPSTKRKADKIEVAPGNAAEWGDESDVEADAKTAAVASEEDEKGSSKSKGGSDGDEDDSHTRKYAHLDADSLHAAVSMVDALGGQLSTRFNRVAIDRLKKEYPMWNDNNLRAWYYGKYKTGTYAAKERAKVKKAKVAATAATEPDSKSLTARVDALEKRVDSIHRLFKCFAAGAM